MKFRFLALAFAITVSTCACNANDVHDLRVYLSQNYCLEYCADIFGQKNNLVIPFNDYGGKSYTDYFDLNSSFLDMHVIIEDEKAKGVGELKLTRRDDPYQSVNVYFDYYCKLDDTSGGNIISTLDNVYSDFVFCIYWCRINMAYIDPVDYSEFTLTLQFGRGTPNEYPPEFDN